mgnify:CR=1 FL=1
MYEKKFDSNFILRFTLSMPLVNTYSEPYLCIRKVPKKFPLIKELIEKEIRTIIPILARRCGIMEDEVVRKMLKVCNEKCISKL